MAYFRVGSSDTLFDMDNWNYQVPAGDARSDRLHQEEAANFDSKKRDHMPGTWIAFGSSYLTTGPRDKTNNHTRNLVRTYHAAALPGTEVKMSCVQPSGDRNRPIICF